MELAVLEWGEGGRPLLVLHGFCGAKENYSELAAPLAEEGWHVVVPDQRGHGESDHPADRSAYSFGAFVVDALALADTLGFESFVLLGHSMGGMTAQMLALEHPGRLGALVLMDTSHTSVEMDPELARAGRNLVETGGIPAMVEALKAAGDPLATDAHRRLVAERPGLSETLDAQTLGCSKEMWLSMSQAMFDAPDRLELLGKLRVPTLVVVGEQDAPFVAASRRMADAIPGAALAVLEDAGHSPQLEAPGATVEALLGFLTEPARQPRR